MKLLDIALKDIWRNLRNAFFLVFGLGIPVLATTLFYFAFGGVSSDDEGFSLPRSTVEVVNLDQTGPQYGGFSAGGLLLEFLKSEDLADLMEIKEAEDPASARTAVDNQRAAVAIIIPEGLTEAMIEPGGQADVELYQDPTLTLGPSIVKSILSQFVDGLAGSKIVSTVVSEQLSTAGVSVDAQLQGEILQRYQEEARELGELWQGETNLLLDVRSPSGEEEESDMRMGILSMIMAAMMVFYVFFTGAASAQSILQEEEEGTLARLFTTPTPLSTILGGKIVAAFAVTLVQIVVLLIASNLIFNINWGKPVPVTLVTIGQVAVAGSFGIFVTSFLKNTKQSGIVYGGVLTVLGMVGMLRVFTMGVPGTADATAKISLFVPQGWGVQAWQILLDGGGLNDVTLSIAVMLGLALVFFVIGLLKFRKRFA